MASHSNGISALQLQKQLSLGSYKSAWFLAAKLRLAMMAPGRSPLKGLVEADETTLPCRSKEDPGTSGGGRSAQGKLLIADAVELEGGRPGRIRLAEIKNFTANCLHGFIADNLDKDATAKTDGWSAYPGAKDIKHEPHGRAHRASLDPSRVRQLQDLGAWRLSRPESNPLPELSR